MTVFILICALLVAVAIALLVWPLLRQPAADGAVQHRSGIAAAIVAATLPLAAFVAYFWASDWPWDPAVPVEQHVGAQDLERMVGLLQQRLSRQPDDVEGWKLLGRSATVLGNAVLARDAFAQAYTRTEGQDADAVVGYAESLVLYDEREIDGQAAQLFEQAIAMEPDNPRALWYGGIVAYRRGDLAVAQQRWVELQNQELPTELRQLVAERLSEIDVAQGGVPASKGAEPVASGAVRVSIQLADTMAARAPPQALLFLIARRGDGGPPLAVVRRNVDAWPIPVTMTDADAMVPGSSLAGAGALKLVARISRSGQPTASSGDLYGELSYDFAATAPVSLIIDRIVP